MPVSDVVFFSRSKKGSPKKAADESGTWRVLLSKAASFEPVKDLLLKIKNSDVLVLLLLCIKAVHFCGLVTSLETSQGWCKCTKCFDRGFKHWNANSSI